MALSPSAAPSPLDVYPDCDGPEPFVRGALLLPERSLKVFVCEARPKAPVARPVLYRRKPREQSANAVFPTFALSSV
jgi:hypothetical protein